MARERGISIRRELFEENSLYVRNRTQKNGTYYIFLMKRSSISRNLMESFRDLLCDERKKRKLSQQELSAKCGLSRQTVSLFECGKRMPTLLSLFYLSKGLNMSSVKLLSLLIKKIEAYERKR